MWYVCSSLTSFVFSHAAYSDILNILGSSTCLKVYVEARLFHHNSNTTITVRNFIRIDAPMGYRDKWPLWASRSEDMMYTKLKYSFFNIPDITLVSWYNTWQQWYFKLCVGPNSILLKKKSLSFIKMLYVHRSESANTFPISLFNLEKKVVDIQWFLLIEMSFALKPVHLYKCCTWFTLSAAAFK